MVAATDSTVAGAIMVGGGKASALPLEEKGAQSKRRGFFVRDRQRGSS